MPNQFKAIRLYIDQKHYQAYKGLWEAAKTVSDSEAHKLTLDEWLLFLMREGSLVVAKRLQDHTRTYARKESQRETGTIDRALRAGAPEEGSITEREGGGSGNLDRP